MVLRFAATFGSDIGLSSQAAFRLKRRNHGDAKSLVRGGLYFLLRSPLSRARLYRQRMKKWTSSSTKRTR